MIVSYIVMQRVRQCRFDNAQAEGGPTFRRLESNATWHVQYGRRPQKKGKLKAENTVDSFQSIRYF